MQLSAGHYVRLYSILSTRLLLFYYYLLPVLVSLFTSTAPKCESLTFITYSPEPFLNNHSKTRQNQQVFTKTVGPLSKPVDYGKRNKRCCCICLLPNFPSLMFIFLQVQERSCGHLFQSWSTAANRFWDMVLQSIRFRDRGWMGLI